MTGEGRKAVSGAVGHEHKGTNTQSRSGKTIHLKTRIPGCYMKAVLWFSWNASHCNSFISFADAVNKSFVPMFVVRIYLV